MTRASVHRYHVTADDAGCCIGGTYYAVTRHDVPGYGAMQIASNITREQDAIRLAIAVSDASDDDAATTATRAWYEARS